MATDHPIPASEAAAEKPAARLFAVRLWKEELAGGSEYRGSVRDVVSGGLRGFHDWSGLVAFMVARLEQDERAPSPGSKEEK